MESADYGMDFLSGYFFGVFTYIADAGVGATGDDNRAPFLVLIATAESSGIDSFLNVPFSKLFFRGISPR